MATIRDMIIDTVGQAIVGATVQTAADYIQGRFWPTVKQAPAQKHKDEDLVVNGPIACYRCSPNGRDTELRFSFRGLTFLQETALDFRGYNQLVIVIHGTDPREGFCIHLDPDSSRKPNQEHTFRYRLLMAETKYCPGVHSRLTYQLYRSFWDWLWHTKDFSVDAVTNVFFDWLQCLPSRCIICGAHENARLYRPSFCEQHYNWESFGPRGELAYTADIRQDPDVVELLLTTIYAGAQENNVSMLPESPIPEPIFALQALSKIPPISALKQNSMSMSVMSLNEDSLALLAWACTMYRGFLISVPDGPFHVSKLSNAKQFLLADAGSRLERRFEALLFTRVPFSPPFFHKNTIFFHGTRMDRLYAIFTHGLRVLSQDPNMQSNGAVYGTGIYLADNPNMALQFTKPPQVRIPFRTRNMEWYRNKVLLCVEAARPPQLVEQHPVLGGKYLAKDESVLIIRYIFLLPPWTDGVWDPDGIRGEIWKNLGMLRSGRQ